MTVTVELCGLELFGRHGVLDEERRDGQPFVFDLWLDVPEAAARSDRLEDAVDYRDVVAVVREISDGRAFHLLEALAGAVADAILGRFPVERVRVRVRKPDVNLAARVDYAAVSVERARSST
jgi:7,8-dihydroneopterin aldolase/epimerase/oxygenase